MNEATEPATVLEETFFCTMLKRTFHIDSTELLRRRAGHCHQPETELVLVRW